MKPLGSQLIAEFINCSEHVLDDKENLEQILTAGIRKCGLTLVSVDGHQFDPIGVTVVAVIGESHVVIHTYPEARHASVDIFTCSNGSHAPVDLLEYLKSRLLPGTVKAVEINRGNPLEVKEQNWIASFSSSGYETRYHVQGAVFSKRSRYQQIDIIDNDDFGRMLFLDRDLQIAERDAHIYNACMVAPLVAGTPPKRAAILGGGDGGVLYELLKCGPDNVVLVDIDEEVVRASKKYLRNVCKDAFDRPNVEVVFQDANTYLKNHRGFDGIIYDLTMFPEALTRKRRSAFLREMFSKIRCSLNDGGVVSLQCCSDHDPDTKDLLTAILTTHFEQVRFESRFIPSFCENWVFASAVARAGPTKSASRGARPRSAGACV